MQEFFENITPAIFSVAAVAGGYLGKLIFLQVIPQIQFRNVIQDDYPISIPLSYPIEPADLRALERREHDSI